MKPVVFGCRTDNFTPDQLTVFKEHQPLGMILFAEPFKVGPDAVKRVIAQVKDQCPDLKCFVDMEGGPVNRMKPDFGHGWRRIPAARDFAELARTNLALACEAIFLNAQMIGYDLYNLGITVDCAPVVDLVSDEAIATKGNEEKPHATAASLFRRSYGDNPEIVTACGKAFADALHSMGVTSVLKHAPGYGRVAVDPHYGVDKIRVSRADLLKTDLVPYEKLKDYPAIMTAHTVYEDIDLNPSTLSPVMMSILREDAGFKGVIIADSIEMNAIYPEGFSKTDFDQYSMGLPLPGTLTLITHKVLNAGCDVVMHSDCSRDFKHTTEVLEAAPVLSAQKSQWLLDKMTVARTVQNFDYQQAQRRLQDILVNYDFGL